MWRQAICQKADIVFRSIKTYSTRKREFNLLFRRMDVIGFVLSCSTLAKKNFKLEHDDDLYNSLQKVHHKSFKRKVVVVCIAVQLGKKCVVLFFSNMLHMKTWCIYMIISWFGKSFLERCLVGCSFSVLHTYIQDHL